MPRTKKVLTFDNVTPEDLENASEKEIEQLCKSIDKSKAAKRKIKQTVEWFDEQAKKHNKIEADVTLTRKMKNHLKFEAKTWWTLRSLLGNDWAHWFILIGARERGKSFAVYAFAVYQRLKKGIPFFWVRLNEPSIEKMLKNNGADFGESVVNEAWNLHFVTKGDDVYINDNTKNPIKPENHLCKCLPLSTAHNYKGSSIYKADKWVGCNIIVDEFQFETFQKKTFDELTQLKILIENVCRSNYKGVRIFLIGNATQDCSTILSKAFKFIPTSFGLFKIRSKKPAECAVIDNIPNTEAYLSRRSQSFLAALEKFEEGSGNSTNQIKRDISLIYKGRLTKPSYILKFSNYTEDWFTVWDGNVIKKYNGEKVTGYAMVRYLDEKRNVDMVNMVFDRVDNRTFKFRSLITQITFKDYLSKIKKS